MWRTVAALSVLWCVLVVAPAVSVPWLLAPSTGTAGRAWALGLWVAGYVVQLLVFMAIARRATRGTGLGWVIASVIPWVADWTAPASMWGPLLCAVVVLGYGAWLTKQVAEVDRVRVEGLRSDAVIVEVIRPLLNVVVDKLYVRRTLRVRVQPPDGTAPYEAAAKSAFLLGEVPEPGDRLVVLAHPQRREHIEIAEDEPIVRAAADDADLDPETAEQLRRLVTMRDRGDLSDAEFSTAKRRLLDG